MTDPSFRWAILGTGGVARKFVLDLHASGAGQAVVVASRNADKARAFAATFGIASTAPDYASAAAAEVDAVYIATPPALHETHAQHAIAAGTAVLIEKPFAADAQAARRIAEAAQAAGVFAMEAMWTRFQPLIEALNTHITAGDLGEIRSFEARFMAANTPHAGTSLFDAAAGGALLHRGIYPLSLARHLLGPVTEMQSLIAHGETGTDEDSVLILRHVSGALSSLRASLRAAGPDGLTVAGTRATADLTGPVYRPVAGRLMATHPAPPATGQTGPRRFEGVRESAFGLRLSRTLSHLKALAGRNQTRLGGPPAGNGYRYQALAVRDAVREGRTEDARMPLAESIEILDLINRARTAASTAQEKEPRA